MYVSSLVLPAYLSEWKERRRSLVENSPMWCPTDLNTSVMPLPGDSTQPNDLFLFICFLSGCGILKIGMWIRGAMTLHIAFIYFTFGKDMTHLISMSIFRIDFCWFNRAARLIQLTCRTNVAWIFVSRSHFQRCIPVLNRHLICLM